MIKAEVVVYKDQVSVGRYDIRMNFEMHWVIRLNGDFIEKLPFLEDAVKYCLEKGNE